MCCDDNMLWYLSPISNISIFCGHIIYLTCLPFWFFCRYEAEIDQGSAYRCCQPWIAILCLPYFWVWGAARGLGVIFQGCTCDEIICWLRKEYSTRTFFRVYPNRIEFNVPKMRIPFGMLGCGSWNADYVTTNVSILLFWKKSLPCIP